MDGHIALWQVLLLTLYSMYQIIDEISIVSSLSQPVWAGLITGAVMGDIPMGLLVGGSLQLTVLGVGTFGGSSKIDANSGTVLATAFSISTGMSAQTAVAAIGIPVASLMIQTDILGRFTNTFFQHRINHFIETDSYSAIERNYLYGTIPWALSRGIPVFLALQFGGSFVTSAVKVLDTKLLWLSNGLATSGALLPAVGFAILLRYLPVKKHLAYLIFGFALTALFSTLFTSVQSIGTAVSGLSKAFTGTFNNVSMVAIALIGLTFAMIEYKRQIDLSKVTDSVSKTAVNTSNDSSEQNNSQDGEIYGDED